MGQPKLWLANGLAGDVICVRPVRLYYSTGNALYRYNFPSTPRAKNKGGCLFDAEGFNRWLLIIDELPL